MSKAIVFYKDDLLSVQDLALRKEHEIEDIIFVPLETEQDIAGITILETIEKPFRVYNYLNDPKMVIALCDKISDYSVQHKYEPQYYIWVNRPVRAIKQPYKSQPRVETIMPKIKLNIIVYVSTLSENAIDLKEDELSKVISFKTIDGVRKFDDRIYRGIDTPTIVFIDERLKDANKLKRDIHNSIAMIPRSGVNIVKLIGTTIEQLLLERSELIDTIYTEATLSGETNPQGTKMKDVMIPTSWMTSGLAIGNVAPWGYDFKDNHHIHVYTSGEPKVLDWFNIFFLGLITAKREFPLLKAVMYNFDNTGDFFGKYDSVEFLEDCIRSILYTVGAPEGVKIFNHTQMAEFKAYVTLTEDEIHSRTVKTYNAASKERSSFNINVDDMPVTNTVKQVMGRLKHKPEERPDPHLSYGEAIEMCKKGIDVACVNWNADTFLTVNSGAYVHADSFWSPGNKRVAMSRPDKSMSVFPHFLRTDSFGTLPHMVDFNDQFSEWVVASDRVKVKNAKIDKTDGLDKLVLEFGLDTFSTPDFELAPFWIVYDVLAKLPNRVTVIGDQRSSLLPHIVGSMKEAHQQRGNLVEESFNIDEDGIEGIHYSFRGVDFLCSAGLSETIASIRAGQITDVILDDDSIKTDSRLDKLKEALQEANVNWVTVSVKEQLFGIVE